MQTDIVTDGRVDMSQLIFAFGDYVNVPKHHISGFIKYIINV